MREVEAGNGIRDLAAEMFGVSRHWHKRIVRSGPNTLQPYAENPPDRVIGDQVGHWILEVHLAGTERQIGGFFEELLDLGLDPAQVQATAEERKYSRPSAAHSRPCRARRSR